MRWQIEWRLAAIQNGMRDAVAYPITFAIELATSALVPVGIQLILWSSIFSQSGVSSFAGMDHSSLITYTFTSILFSQVRGGNYDFSLIEKIRTGNLNNYLLKPIGVVEFTYFRSVGEKIWVVAFFTLLGSIALLFTTYSYKNFLIAMLMAIMGNVISYIFGAALAAVAFYWENAFAILIVKNMLVSFLSGELLPLSLIPAHLEWTWKYTPFYLYVYGPTQIALGKWTTHEILFHFQVGFAWILFFAIIQRLVWKFSIHRYQGLGG